MPITYLEQPSYSLRTGCEHRRVSLPPSCRTVFGNQAHVHMPSTPTEPIENEDILIDLTTPSPPTSRSAQLSSSPSFEVPTVYSQRIRSRQSRPSEQQNKSRTTQASSQSTYFVISDDSDLESVEPEPKNSIRPITPPQPTQDRTPAIDSSPTSTSSTTDAAEVERSLLQNTPPPSSPPIRFLPSDIKLLNLYLYRPISTVMATCSSLILPPHEIPGLPLDKLETLYSKDRWRIKSELITAPGISQKVTCWIYGQGWPAKTFIICGWLVGVDRREKFITYHIDDGTAVLECQINISHINKVFDSSSQDYSSLPHEKKAPPKSKDINVQAPPGPDDSSTSQAPPPKTRSDPRLDPYRRLPSPDRKSHPSSSTTVRGTNNPGLEAPHLENSVAETVSEETITKYAELKIGTVLKLIGKPKSLFRDTKRVFDLEKVIIVQDNQSDEEIRFRRHLKFCRSHIYNQPFRLANVWPEGAKSLGAVNPHSTKFLPNSSAPVKNQQTVEKEKEPRRLKLPPVARLTSQQITFSNYLNYVSHYIVSRYDQHDLNTTTSKADFSYHELKRKMDCLEPIVLEDFSIEDLLAEGREDDRHSSLRSEMRKFTEKLISQPTQERSESQASEPDRHKKQQSIFLTDGDNPRLSRRRLSTSKAMVTRAIQALVNQGTIIISPKDERRFALPNVSSLGPKIIQIINRLPPPSSSDHPVSPVVSANHILRNLARDELWKAVHPQAVQAVLRHLQLRQTGPDSWRIP
ncbi:hypothetical protein PGT21_032354 [Puccinia graminis f. sp. tritici]|uniref:CST complex subunit STN1 n=2 Tax=Puccinia graminis f. sp. tritici TaxID=56615 RepID=A0A5B0P450_PUCGR|nr:hypothetical protein PGTUg99_004085 [Puccinia graminis f. sp. tritici]KAA1094898.1 hypothetical protein PGT21_032354 [Puccinia graminis f. sp. tritici]